MQGSVTTASSLIHIKPQHSIHQVSRPPLSTAPYSLPLSAFVNAMSSTTPAEKVPTVDHANYPQFISYASTPRSKATHFIGLENTDLKGKSVLITGTS